MSNDEKLMEICNAIENLLKISNVNNGWLELDYQNLTFGILSDKDVTTYRKLIQCFRHSSEEAILERKSFSEEQKKFLINYGITICETIHRKTK